MKISADLTISITDNYTVFSLSVAFSLITIFLGVFILIVVWQTRPRLHTRRHLLMCNSSIALIFYCAVQNNNYFFLIFLPGQTSDIGCRWRGYFTYISIVATTYSFLIQTVSRLLFVVYSRKYPSLISFKAHYILITLNWLAAILIPLPAIITEDIHFIPGSICWVPFKAMLHVILTVVVHYCVPLAFMIVVYVYIYYRVKNVKRNSITVLKKTNNGKRDVELLRNILVTVIIFLTCGIPNILFIITFIKIFYLISIVILSLSTVLAQVCAILLDRDLREIVRDMFIPTTCVVTFENTRENRTVQITSRYNLKTSTQQDVCSDIQML